MLLNHSDKCQNAIFKYHPWWPAKVKRRNLSDSYATHFSREPRNKSFQEKLNSNVLLKLKLMWTLLYIRCPYRSFSNHQKWQSPVRSPTSMSSLVYASLHCVRALLIGQKRISLVNDSLHQHVDIIVFFIIAKDSDFICIILRFNMPRTW